MNLKAAAGRGVELAVTWLIPISLILGAWSWVVIDYYQTRARANASYNYLVEQFQKQQASPAPNVSK